MSLLRKLLFFGIVAVVFVSAVQAQRPQRESEQQRGNERTPDKLSEGDPAPDFTLRLMDGAENETVTLSDYRGKRPVALIFGSYT